jgi:hypothetical protein
MVDTTNTRGSSDPLSLQGEAGAPELTEKMIEAGVQVLWKSGAIENPTSLDRELVRRVYLAMLDVLACRQ